MSKKRRGAVLPLVVILVVLGIGAVVFFLTKPTQSPNSSSATAKLTVTPSNSDLSTSADLPPLYPGVEWGEPIEGNYSFTTEDRETMKLAGYRVESRVAFSQVDSYNDYYLSYFEKNKWTQVDIADGPGISLTEYKKRDQHFTFGFQLEDSDNAILFIEYN